MILIGLLIVGCGVEKLGPAHPIDALDYPVGVTADPSQEVIWVTSGDFDLAYEGGAVMGIDVRTHQFIPGAVAEVGSFPGSFQLLERSGKSAHGYVTSRGTDAVYHLRISWDEANKPSVDCDGGTTTENGLVRCTETGLTERVISEESTLNLGSDPFSVLLHPASQPDGKDLLFTSAMGDGKLATFEIEDDGSLELVGNMTLAAGLFALTTDPKTGRIYSTSKALNTLEVLEVSESPSEDTDNPYLTQVEKLVLPSATSSDHARGLAFTQDGSRLLVLHRAPASVVVVDASADYGDRILAKIPVGKSPSEIKIVPGNGQVPELAYVSCFSTNRVDVIDPAQGMVVDSIRTGRGPFGLALIDNPNLGIRRLYVVNFHAQSVGVIELDPTSPYFHTQIAEIR